MINTKQLEIVAAQCAMAGALAFGIVAYSSKTALAGSLVMGGMAALILGGNLAVYYAVGAFGESRQMSEWKVRLLQTGAMALFNLALTVTCVAIGVMATPTAIFINIALSSLVIMPACFGIYQRVVYPSKICKDMLPKSVFSLPEFALDPPKKDLPYNDPLFPYILKLNFISATVEPYRRQGLDDFIVEHPALQEEATRYIYGNDAV